MRNGQKIGRVINENSTNTALDPNQIYTGKWYTSDDAVSLTVALKTDASGSLYIDQSTDSVNVDSSLEYIIEPNINDTHRVVCTRKFFRVRLVNGSTPQTFLRLQTQLGNYGVLSSPLNQSTQQDADAVVTKAFSEEFLISAGYVADKSLVNKFGRNPDIDTASVPEDVWNGGGAYTGFPTGAPEEFQVLSSDPADTGDVTFTYLPSSTSTEYLSATVTLTGTTPVNTGIVGFRMHTARYDSKSPTAFNVGAITIRHRTTTTNIFCVMPIGRSQSNLSGYRVPANHTAYIKRLFCRVIGATTGTVDGALWIRTNGQGPRLRRPFSAAQQANFEEEPYGGLRVEEKSDIIVRITAASTNNLDVIAGYDLILVKNN